MDTPARPAAQPELPLSVSVDLARSSVHVAGELDRHSAHHLLDAVVMLATRPTLQWSLDVADVTFCDVGGLRALNRVAVLAASSGRSLRLSRTSRPVARLVGLVGHDRVFPPAGPGSRKTSQRNTTPPGRRPGTRSPSAAAVRCGTTGTA